MPITHSIVHVTYRTTGWEVPVVVPSTPPAEEEVDAVAGEERIGVSRGMTPADWDAVCVPVRTSGGSLADVFAESCLP